MPKYVSKADISWCWSSLERSSQLCCEPRVVIPVKCIWLASSACLFSAQTRQKEEEILPAPLGLMQQKLSPREIPEGNESWSRMTFWWLRNPGSELVRQDQWPKEPVVPTLRATYVFPCAKAIVGRAETRAWNFPRLAMLAEQKGHHLVCPPLFLPQIPFVKWTVLGQMWSLMGGRAAAAQNVSLFSSFLVVLFPLTYVSLVLYVDFQA